jgi:hypothetical protein
MPKVKGITIRREVADRLLALREVKFSGNASEMARSLGLTPQRWFNYETGRRALDYETAWIVVEVHSVDYNWLYGGVFKGLSRKLAEALRSKPADVRRLKRKRKKRGDSKRGKPRVKVDTAVLLALPSTD